MSEYPRPGYAADCIVFRPTKKGPEILLIQRGKDPHKDKWAFPGGHVEFGETSREAAIRELKEETGLDAEPFQFVGVADGPDRDPRGWYVSAVWAFMVKQDSECKAGDDAKNTKWVHYKKMDNDLAFDHNEIYDMFFKVKFIHEIFLEYGFVYDGHVY